MKLVPSSLLESQTFYKSDNPLRNLDIGLISKINKITSENLELLSLYTNGNGKGDEDGGNDFPEIFGENEWQIPIKKAREIYGLLNPYEYYFGDHFGEGQEEDMKEYIEDSLKDPRYNYAYNYFPWIDENEWHIFLSEIELPSANKIK